MQLDKRTITLSTGETAWYEYDRDGDVLEIIFRPAEATCAVELTESIILRFDWETNEPLSLSFISLSQLVQPAQYGPIHFQLLVDEWPEAAQDKVWTMLQTTPLDHGFPIRRHGGCFSILWGFTCCVRQANGR